MGFVAGRMEFNLSHPKREAREEKQRRAAGFFLFPFSCVGVSVDAGGFETTKVKVNVVVIFFALDDR